VSKASIFLSALLVIPFAFLPLRVLNHSPQPCAAATMAATPAPKLGQVTRMSLRAVPREYRGPCPKVIRFIGEITFDGPGKMLYHIERSDGAKPTNAKEVSFAGAGTKRVDDTWEIRKSYTGWELLASASMRSNKAEFTVNCTP
jgi:hypothetical protein